MFKLLQKATYRRYVDTIWNTEYRSDSDNTQNSVWFEYNYDYNL